MTRPRDEREVAETPTHTIGVDHGDGPDVPVAMLVNTETGEFAVTNGAHGFLFLRWSGTWTWANPPAPGFEVCVERAPARETNTIADLSKKEWKP